MAQWHRRHLSVKEKLDLVNHRDATKYIIPSDDDVWHRLSLINASADGELACAISWLQSGMDEGRQTTSVTERRKKTWVYCDRPAFFTSERPRRLERVPDATGRGNNGTGGQEAPQPARPIRSGAKALPSTKTTPTPAHPTWSPAADDKWAKRHQSARRNVLFKTNTASILERILSGDPTKVKAGKPPVWFLRVEIPTTARCTSIGGQLRREPLGGPP